jgi:hypothetical protein
MDDALWHRRLRLAWEALERVAEHLTPGHPAEPALLRALQAVEEDWRTSHCPARAAEHTPVVARVPDRPG